MNESPVLYCESGLFIFFQSLIINR